MEKREKMCPVEKFSLLIRPGIHILIDRSDTSCVMIHWNRWKYTLVDVSNDLLIVDSRLIYTESINSRLIYHFRHVNLFSSHTFITIIMYQGDDQCVVIPKSPYLYRTGLFSINEIVWSCTQCSIVGVLKSFMISCIF